jgi:hypothetical protein
MILQLSMHYRRKAIGYTTFSAYTCARYGSFRVPAMIRNSLVLAILLIIFELMFVSMQAPNDDNKTDPVSGRDDVFSMTNNETWREGVTLPSLVSHAEPAEDDVTHSLQSAHVIDNLTTTQVYDDLVTVQSSYGVNESITWHDEHPPLVSHCRVYPTNRRLHYKVVSRVT